MFKHSFHSQWLRLKLIIKQIENDYGLAFNMSNFHPLDVVDRGGETQRQVGENLN